MYLSELQVEHFLPYESARLTLPEAGLVFIAGPNNSGKSALLAAFDVVAGRTRDREWRFAGASTPARVFATFVLTDDERQSIFDAAPGSPHRKEWMASDAFRSVQFTFTETFRYMNAESVALGGHDGVMRPVARIEYPGPGSFTMSQLALPRLMNEVPAAANWEVGQTSSGGGRGPEPDYSVIESYPVVNDLWRQWATPLYHFSGVRTGTPVRSQIADVRATLEPTGVNLAESLLYLFTQSAPAWDVIQAAIRQVLPDVGELVTPVSGTQVEAAFIDPVSHFRRNIKALGAGVEQVLMTTYVGVTQPPGSVILIEEPETNLHAAAERELLRHLTEWSKERLIVLSTHSTVFLDQAAATAYGTWVVERESGKSLVRSADTNFASVLRAVGVRLSDILSAEQLILVEGESDAEILQAWFPELVLTRRTAVIPLGGGDRAYQIEMVKTVFEAADELGRDIVFLRDRDELSSRNRTKLNQLERVTIVARREIENYLLDPVAILSVLEEREAQSGSTVERRFSESELVSFIDETADSLKAVVNLKSVADELAPIRLVDRDAVKRIAREHGGLDRLREAVSAALPDAPTQLAEIDSIWGRVERRVSRGWSKHKLDIAPGTEILEAIWRAHGGSYDKRRDGPRIAAAMSTGPDEIRGAVSEFLGTGEE
jgi:energy-coupling factor transporter ATP-binding protein EcfA2